MMAIKIIIECRECDKNIEDGQDIICVECYNKLFDEKNEMEDRLQKRIDDLEEELADIKNRFEI